MFNQCFKVASTGVTVWLKKTRKTGIKQAYMRLHLHHWLPDPGNVVSDPALWSSIKEHQRGSVVSYQIELPITTSALNNGV